MAMIVRKKNEQVLKNGEGGNHLLSMNIIAVIISLIRSSTMFLPLHENPKGPKIW